MSLRDLVTGSDVCAPNGEGSSNAVGNLANTLLGTSKVQDRLQELPGPSGSSVVHPATPQDVAHAAAQGNLPAIPGLGPPPQEFGPDSALHGGAGPSGLFREFEEIYSQQAHRFAGQDAEKARVIEESFRAFMHCGQSGVPYTPAPFPDLQLSVEEQCQIRDRVSILSRQMFSQQGAAFADEQALNFMGSLNIDPRTLPMGVPRVHPFEWNQVWDSAGVRPDLMGGPMLEAARKSRAEWDALWHEQGKMQSLPQRDVNAWADEFAKQDPQGWVGEFSNLSLGQNEWAAEFESTQKDSGESASASEQKQNAQDVSLALVEQMSNDPDPKFQNSKFLKFVSKLSRGEISIEGNQVIEKSVGDSWAEEFGGPSMQSQVPGNQWASEFAGMDQRTSDAWATEFGNLEGGWLQGSEVEEWVKEFDRVAQMPLRETANNKDYILSDSNPFAGDPQALLKGREFFGKGILTEAALAIEAEVQQNPDNAEAWRLLGIVHAENDDDVKAISAFLRAREIDPLNLEVLLALGVSYANELQEAETVEALTSWLGLHKDYKMIVERAGQPPDPSQELAFTRSTFQTARETCAPNADLLAAMGVLNHLARDFAGAIECFERALDLKPQDYSLWNKLGATQANSAQSKQALNAYQRALDIKPNYMRGWTNLGISYANLGEYEKSAEFYIRALSLNAKAEGVWGYLRSSILCSGAMDLLPLVDAEDIQGLKQKMGL